MEDERVCVSSFANLDDVLCHIHRAVGIHLRVQLAKLNVDPGLGGAVADERADHDDAWFVDLLPSGFKSVLQAHQFLDLVMQEPMCTALNLPVAELAVHSSPQIL